MYSLVMTYSTSQTVVSRVKRTTNGVDGLPCCTEGSPQEDSKRMQEEQA
jgi:hypothetical protein